MEENPAEPEREAGVVENNHENVDNENEEAEGVQNNNGQEEWIHFVAEQLVEWNVTQDELYRLVSIVHGDFNEATLRGSPLVQPSIMRCMTEQMDFQTLKNLRQSGKIMKNMVDPYFYKRGIFKVRNSTEFYKFIKKSNTENHQISSKIRRLMFTEDIDLFEVSRVMYRARLNLKELSVYTTAPKLRGEFQNIASVLPLMTKLHTLRLNLPRRYLLHPLFRSSPLTIKTLSLNFENAHPVTLQGTFSTLTGLQFLEVAQDQMKYLSKLTAVVPIDLKRLRPKKNANGIPNEFQVFKITRREPVKKTDT